VNVGVLEIMDLMDRPRIWHERIDGDAQAEAEETFWSIEDEKIHAELVAGQVIVSPAPTPWHASIGVRLTLALAPASYAKGWGVYPDVDVRLVTTGEVFRPDFVVARDLERFSEMGQGIPGECVVLATEIVSPSGIRTDREIKRVSYAKNAIPLYLVIDRFTTTASATVFCQPDGDDYTTSESAAIGDNGGKLYLPDPLDMVLDLSAFEIKADRTG
jgi:Uma2 family endonuclease